MHVTEMIDDVINIVREASELMLAPEDMTITHKGGYENIVTSADIAVQEFLRSRLAMLTPDAGFVCEEGDIADISHDRVWIIDPIDGTANYARGADQCAICAGLYGAGTMQLSVVYLPRTGEMFHAERGKGAWRNGSPIHVSERTFEDSVMCTALPVYHKEQASWCGKAIHDVFMQCNDIRRLGAAAPELCYVAMGRFDMYFEYLLGAWDFAAASLILEEAGGCLCDLDGRPLNPLRPSGVIGANSRENLERLTETIKRHKLQSRY